MHHIQPFEAKIFKIIVISGEHALDRPTGKARCLVLNETLFRLHYIKKLLSMNAVPYRALLILRLNDLRDSAHLAS